MRATITLFDAKRGDGELESENGQLYWFHCVEIADGSRDIDVGVAVDMVPRVGLRGRDEASQIHKVN